MVDIYHHHHIKGVFTRELFEIYFLLAFKKLALSMIGLFLPLYFYVELGYPVKEIIYFYIVFAIFFAIMLAPATKVISKYGAKHSMIVSTPLVITGLIMALLLPYYSWMFYLAAFFLGAEGAFFWTGFHIDAVLQGKKKSLGKESGMITVISLLPTVIGPLVGGLIIKFFSFTVLFVIACLLMFVSFIPLLKSKEIYVKTRFNMKYFFKDGHTKYFFAYMAQGLRNMARALFWPLFIFMILGGYLTLGIYGSVATLIVSLAGLIIGNYSDKTRKGLMVKVSAFFGGIIWIVKAFVTTVGQIFVIGPLSGIVHMGVTIPLLAKSYNKAKKERVAGFIIFREICLRIGQLTLLCLMLFIEKIEWSFFLAAASTVFFFFI